jgi:hypothetical protein
MKQSEMELIYKELQPFMPKEAEVLHTYEDDYRYIRIVKSKDEDRYKVLRGFMIPNPFGEDKAACSVDFHGSQKKMLKFFVDLLSEKWIR